jgi:ribosomal protein S18 acetylase RimI-like enzyme
MDIKKESLTPELKIKIFDGFGRHALEMTGHDETFENTAFVLNDGDTFAGAVVVETFWGALHLKYVYVEENYRGKGFATQLMEKCFDFARENQCPFIFVETMNFQALGFYQKMGFELEFTRSGYCRDTSFNYLKKTL